MTCRYTFKGKEYSAAEFMRVLAELPVSESAKFMPNVKSIPSAPLIESTDEWATLAFKRMARWGAENNFDRIAWATGEQNADVFDLSKRVSRIEYEKNPSDNTFNVMVHGLDGQGLLWSSRRATSDQVADAVGKEVAEKMDAGEGNRVGGIGSDMMSLSGQGLKVGGKGMRGFYDKILPAAVNKWAKPFGARTEMAEVSGTMQPTITITPKMREAALKGLPLFSFAGKKAKTANIGTLEEAQSRIAAGESKEDVRKDTGWFKGRDDKWRFEIDDSGASLKRSIKSLDRRSEAKRINAVTYRKNDDGTYDIVLSPPNPQQVSDLVSIVGVTEQVVRSIVPAQTMQDIRRGRGEEDFIGDFEEAKQVKADFEFPGFNALPLDQVLEHPALFDAYPTLRDVMVQVDPSIGIGGSFIVMQDGERIIRTGVGKQLSVLLHEIQHGIQDVEGFAKGGNAEELMPKVAKDAHAMRLAVQSMIDDETSAIDKSKLRQILDAIPDQMPLAISYYNRLAGEVESRNVQARQRLTPDQRRDTSPQDTQDVADDQQIVRFSDPNFSQSADYTFKESDYRSSVVSWAKDNLDFTAPNGKPAWQNFVRWFGDSKVVDRDGKPLVVYHGGAKGINSFDKTKIGTSFGYDKDGFFFTTERGNYPGTADNYAGKEGDVYPVYLSLQNAYTIEKFAADLGIKISDLIMQEGSPQSPITVFDTDREEIVRRVQEGKYDGVAFQIDYGDGTKEGMFMAIEPEQIKSATGNIGSFDSATPDIRYSMPRSPSIAPAQQRAAQNRQTLTSGLGANPQQPSFVAGDYFGPGIAGWGRRFREAVQDRLNSALYVQRDIEAAGRIVEEAADVHARENFMHGRVGNVLEMDQRNYIAPLRSWMRNQKLDYKMLDDYLEARHAEERNKAVAKKNADQPDGGSGMTTQQADDFLNGTEAGFRSGKKLTPELKRKMDRAATYLDRLLEKSRERALANGLITQDEYNAFHEYKFYVPLKNEIDGREFGFGGGTGSGVDARPRVTRAALGRGAGNRAGDILSHALADTHRLVVIGEKARVGRTLARLVLDNPNKDLWEIEPVLTEQKLNTAGEVYLALQNLNNDPLTMVIKFEGKPYKIRFGDNPVGRRLAAALKNANPLNVGSAVNLMGSINRFYSRMLTSYSPAFVVVNLMRDLFYGTSGIAAEKGAKVLGNAVKNYIPAWQSIWRYSREKGSADPRIEQYRKEFFGAGGLTFFNEGKQAEDYQKDAERFMKGYMKLLAEGSPLQALTKFVEENSFMKFVHDANNVVENTLRFAAFIALRETKTAAHPNGESVEQAAKYAKNMTVNFNRKGTASTLANAVYLFFNAAVQGAHRTIKLLGNRKVKATMASMFAIQAAFAMMLAGTEDDDGVILWDKIPNHVKEKSLVIPMPWTKEGYITIPMPYGFNIFPYSGGRIGGDIYKMMQGDKLKPLDIAADITTAVIGSFSPVNVASGFNRLIPTLPGQLLAQSRANENTFGAPIRDKFLDDKQARAYQGKESTSAVYHWIAQALNLVGGGDEIEKPLGWLDHAPEDIEFIVENIGGGPLRFASQTWAAGENFFYGGEAGWGDVPLISAIIPKPDRGSGTQRVYYDQTLPAIKNDADKIKDAAKRGEDWQDVKVKPEMEDSFKVARKKDGTRAKAPKGWLGPKLEPRRGSLPDLLRKTEKRVRELRDEMRAVRNDPDLSFAKKKIELEQIREEIAKVQSELIKEQREQRREARNNR